MIPVKKAEVKIKTRVATIINGLGPLSLPVFLTNHLKAFLTGQRMKMDHPAAARRI
jgi:hypothetical protein